MAPRQPAQPQPAPAAAPDPVVSALARAVCRLAIDRPGGSADMDRILRDELRLSHSDAEAIIAAAGRQPGS